MGLSQLKTQQFLNLNPLSEMGSPVELVRAFGKREKTMKKQSKN